MNTDIKSHSVHLSTSYFHSEHSLKVMNMPLLAAAVLHIQSRGFSLFDLNSTLPFNGFTSTSVFASAKEQAH